MNHWKRDLAETPECVPIERIGEPLTAEEREHVAHCARCEAETALWEEFRDATPSADEGAAVRWIAAEVARRRAGRPALAAAAVAVVALSIGYLAQDREPAVVAPTGDASLYRSERLEVTGATGDLPTPPTGFSWMAAPGAERYDVVVLEVDRTILWRASTRASSVDLASAVIDQFVPGKTILWEVTARGRDGTILAQSGTQRFRVVVKPRQED